MISRVIVVPRSWVENVIKTNTENPDPTKKQWNLISIYGSSEELLTPANREILKKLNCQKMLSICFWDITDVIYPNVIKAHPDAVLFDKGHAQRIVSFLDRLKSRPESETLIVHCDAGISRSGAVGEFASDYFGLDYAKFKEMNKVLPNHYVKLLLNRAAKNTPIGY